jgi:hypothetical protein
MKSCVLSVSPSVFHQQILNQFVDFHLIQQESHGINVDV